MATALSETAFAMGANVELWLGNAVHQPGEWVKTKRFDTLAKLKDMIKSMKKYDAVIMPAALSDFIPAKTKGKLDSSKPISLEMKKAPKIIDSVRKKHKGVLYSFKLGSNIKEKELIEKAKKLLKSSDCVVANYSEALGSKNTKLALVDKKNTNWIEGSKINLSKTILEKISSEI